MALDDQAVVSRCPAFLWRVAPGFLVIASLDGLVYEASDAASAIWNAIECPISVGGLISTLSDAYVLPPDHIRDDVVRFLGELVAAGSVKIHR